MGGVNQCIQDISTVRANARYGMGILVFVTALIVAIIAGVIGSHLSDDDDQGGYWPKDPNSSGSTSA
jgi:hypothetical protein